MKLLAMDCSTDRASVALLDGDSICREIFWVAERARHENLAPRVERLMRDAGWAWQAIDLFCVGRGPGAYTGLRSSLLAMQAFAMPGGKPVTAVSSMDALAWRLMRDHKIDRITLVGDARRDSIWMGTASRQNIGYQAVSWTLAPRVSVRLEPDVPVATPHWEALADFRASHSPSEWIAESQVPSAADVAALALIRQDAGKPPEPLIPLYLHNAV